MALGERLDDDDADWLGIRELLGVGAVLSVPVTEAEAEAEAVRVTVAVVVTETVTNM